jgi:hypothetical protein
VSEASNIFWAAFGGGAAAGAVIGIIELFRWFASRPLLKVEVTLGTIIETAPSLRTSTVAMDKVFLEARNTHLVPVTVSSFGLGFKRRKGERLVMPPQRDYRFPYEVSGGKELTQWTSIEELLRALRERGRRPSDLRWGWFRASSGKEFRGRIDSKVIATLEREFEKTADR